MTGDRRGRSEWRFTVSIVLAILVTLLAGFLLLANSDSGFSVGG